MIIGNTILITIAILFDVQEETCLTVRNSEINDHKTYVMIIRNTINYY